MSKKVFFILSSFRAGGSERVFWLLSQNFNQSLFDISIVLLSSEDSFFSTDLEGVNVIDLNSPKASRSVIKLYSLLKKEKPDVVFTTGGQINSLVGFIYLLLKKPLLIARPTNQDNSKFLSLKAKLFGRMSSRLYNRFDKVICQSEEVKTYIRYKHQIPESKLVIIPNPVIWNNIIPNRALFDNYKRLILVARLTPQKGIVRLLNIMSSLPPNYLLTIVGEGVLGDEILRRIDELGLTQRVEMLGLIFNVVEVVSNHDLFVLPSYIEGFPNVVIESLSVGIPVVSFDVSGISEIIINTFNGFIVAQNDLTDFKSKILLACKTNWDSTAIKNDVYSRFGIEKITRSYEKLLCGELPTELH